MIKSCLRDTALQTRHSLFADKICAEASSSMSASLERPPERPIYKLPFESCRNKTLFFIVWRVIGTYKTFSLCVCVRASAQRLSGRSVFNARQIYGTQILCDYHRNSWNIGIWGHYQETRGLQQKQNTEQSLLLWKNLYILNSKILLHVFFCPIFLAQVTFPGSQSRKPEKR